MCRLPVNEVSSRAVFIERHAIERDEAQLLRHAIKKNCQIQISDRRRIQHAPELPFSGFILIAAGG